MDRALRSLALARMVVGLTAALVAKSAAGQSPAYDPAFQPATATAPTPLPPVAEPQPAQTVRFQRRGVQVGDVAEQVVTVGLQLTSRYTQSGQIANESQTTLRREQRRRIEISGVESTDQGDRVQTAAIRFDRSRNQSPENPDPQALVIQVVEGKTYLAERRGERMLVTDPAGVIPPIEEYKLVADVAENLAKPNPLATLLLERPIAVGQRILVPREAAAAVLGLRDQVGTIKRFELRLERLEPTPALPAAAAGPPAGDVAIFSAKIETLPNESSPLELTLTGMVAVEVSTCRTVAAEFRGPVQMSTVERTRGDIFQFSAAGELTVAIRSRYSRAAVAHESRFPLGFNR